MQLVPLLLLECALTYQPTYLLSGVAVQLVHTLIQQQAEAQAEDDPKDDPKDDLKDGPKDAPMGPPSHVVLESAFTSIADVAAAVLAGPAARLHRWLAPLATPSPLATPAPLAPLATRARALAQALGGALDAALTGCLGANHRSVEPGDGRARPPVQPVSTP